MTSDLRPDRLPVLPLRDVVVFPHMVVPLFVGREKSVAALEAAFQRADRDILIVTQTNARTNEPGDADLFRVGCIGVVKNILRLPDGTVKVLVEGRTRAQLTSLVEGLPYLAAEVTELAGGKSETVPGEGERLRQDARAAFEAYIKINRRIPQEILSSVTALEEPGQLADTIAAHIALKINQRQELLETADPYSRLAKLIAMLEAESEQLSQEQPQRRQAKAASGQTQAAESAEQIDEFKAELEELAKQIQEKDLPEEARTKLEREFKKLKAMNPMSAEAGVVRTYLDWVLALPWKEVSDDKLDVVEAKRVLDEDHYGLDKPKERILEYLAVQQLRGEVGRGPVLCLVGPPGVGKTSLAKSVARSLGRKFIRISLGGVRDEAEIRGHRRTYVGALPGKIIASLKRAGTSNPVLLLDEIDKMSMDFRGDPASALLEVLDPEQNDTFVDHYIDLDYDLSKVLFITTANNLQAIPWALSDRLEILELGGYTEHDKLQIAKQYLIRRQLDETGMAKAADVSFSDDAIETLIRSYTREAGVRTLERQVGAVCRKLATRHLSLGKAKAKKGSKKVKYDVTGPQVIELLGPEKFRKQGAEMQDRVGVANGLAVTAVGGDLLLVEVSLVPGKGRMTVTGKLGDVMKESVEAAMTYVRSRAHLLGLNKEFAQKIDVHVHFPEGAIPKDGPSAGIAIATALCSALTLIPVRHDVAMTGEITLRGRVLPIGGLKEKVIAAHRAGVTRVVIPRENERDLPEIPAEVLKDIEIIAVDHADQVLQAVLRLDEPTGFLANPTALGRDDLGIHEPEVSITH